MTQHVNKTSSVKWPISGTLLFFALLCRKHNAPTRTCAVAHTNKQTRLFWPHSVQADPDHRDAEGRVVQPAVHAAARPPGRCRPGVGLRVATSAVRRAGACHTHGCGIAIWRCGEMCSTFRFLIPSTACEWSHTPSHLWPWIAQKTYLTTRRIRTEEGAKHSKIL